MDELKDSIESMSSTIELMEGSQALMLEDLESLKFELDHAEPDSFASRVKEAFMRLQPAACSLQWKHWQKPRTIPLATRPVRAWSSACAQDLTLQARARRSTGMSHHEWWLIPCLLTPVSPSG